MNLNCKIKFEKYLKENNLEDKNNILELFSQLNLEQLAEKLLTLDEDEIVGVIQIIKIEENNAHLGRFMLNPLKVGQGFGKNVLELYY